MTVMTRRFVIVMLSASLAFLGACGDDDDDDSSAEAPSPTAIRVTKDFTFAPADLQAVAGGAIAVINTDSQSHTLTADEGGAFDLTLAAGEGGTLTAPSTPGTYPYHCSFHPIMKAQLVVG